MSLLLTRGILQQVINLQSSGTDVTPDAVDWQQTDFANFYVETTSQTISGITTNITLRIEADLSFSAGVTDVRFNSDSIFTDLINTGYSLKTVSNNTGIIFSIDDDGTGNTVSFTIKNTSDGNAVLDTFTLQAVPFNPF